MKTIDILVDNLRRLNVYLWLDGEQLRYRADPAVLTPDLLEDLAVHESALAAFLHNCPTQSAALAPQPISRRSESDPIQLSFAQQRLFFLSQTGTPKYGSSPLQKV